MKNEEWKNEVYNPLIFRKPNFLKKFNKKLKKRAKNLKNNKDKGGRL